MSSQLQSSGGGGYCSESDKAVTTLLSGDVSTINGRRDGRDIKKEVRRTEPIFHSCTRASFFLLLHIFLVLTVQQVHCIIVNTKQIRGIESGKSSAGATNVVAALEQQLWWLLLRVRQGSDYFTVRGCEQDQRTEGRTGYKNEVRRTEPIFNPFTRASL